MEGFEGSIHQVARHLTDGVPCNGWDVWFYEESDGSLTPIDHLRQELRKRQE